MNEPTRYMIERSCGASFVPTNIRKFVFCCADDRHFGITDNRGREQAMICCEENCVRAPGEVDFDSLSGVCRKRYCTDPVNLDKSEFFCKFDRSESDCISFHQRRIGLKEWPEVADLSPCDESRCPLLNMTEEELDDFRMDLHRCREKPDYKEKH